MVEFERLLKLGENGGSLSGLLCNTNCKECLVILVLSPVICMDLK